MSRAALIREAVDRYLALLQAGDRAAELTALFADDATIEDPVGGKVKRGREEVRAHFDGAAARDLRTRLLAIRIAGSSAAAYFAVEMVTPDAVYQSAPIDTFTFDDAGLITSMRAYWGPDDYTAEAPPVTPTSVLDDLTV